MAKIRKTNIYPIKPIPAREDYMPGTDAEDNNKTKSFTIGSIIDSTLLEAGLPSSTTGLLSVENITVTGEVATVTNAVWQIMGVEFTVTSQELPVNYAAEGLYRTDIIVGNGQGVLELIEGVESEDTTVQPTIPTGSVLIGILNVFGTDISPDIPAFNDIKLKPSEAWFKVADTGSVAQIEWGSQNAYRWVGGSGLTLHSLNISSDNTEYRYDGRMFFLCNATADKTITLKHQSETATGNVKFFMPDEGDVVISAGEIAGYRYYASSATTGQLELVISPNIGVESVTGTNVNNTDTSNPIIYYDYYDARTSGVVPDALTDQSDLLNQAKLDALALGYEFLHIPAGHYITNKEVDLTGISVDMYGAVFDASAGIMDYGNENGNFPRSAVIVYGENPEFIGNLSVDATQRSSSITLDSLASPLEQNDILLLYNTTDFSFSPERSYWRDGQFTTVRSQTPSGTTVSISVPIIPTVLPATVTKVYRVSRRRFFVRGGKIIGNYQEGVSTVNNTIRTGLRCGYLANGVIEDIESSNFPEGQIVLANCFNVKVSRITGTKNDELPATSEWYGIVLGGCQDVTVTDCTIYTKRHNIITTRSVFFYYVGGVIQVGLVEIPNRFVTIENNTLTQTFEDASSRCVEFHGNTEYCDVVNNNIHGRIGFGGNDNNILDNNFFIPTGSDSNVSYVFSAGSGKRFSGLIQGNTIKAESGTAVGLLLVQNIANYQLEEGTLTFKDNDIEISTARGDLIRVYPENASSNGASKYNFNIENNNIVIHNTTNNPVLSFAGDNNGSIKSLIVKNNKLTGVGIKADKVTELVLTDNTSVNAPKYGVYGTAITTATVTDNIFRTPNVVSGTALENSIIAFDNTTTLYLDGNTGTAGTNSTNRLYLNTVTNFYRGINRLPGLNSFTSVTATRNFEGLNWQYCKGPSTAITGVTTEQIIGDAVLVKAGEHSDGVLSIEALVAKPADNGNWSLRLYRNTTATIGGNQLAQYINVTNTVNAIPFSRNILLSGTTLTTLRNDTDIYNMQPTGLPVSTFTIDPAQDYYYFFTMTLANGADAATMQYIKMVHTPLT